MKRVLAFADLPVGSIWGYGRDTMDRVRSISGCGRLNRSRSRRPDFVAQVQAALRSRAEPEIFVHGKLAIDLLTGAV